MRRLVLGALVTIMSFSGARVICVDAVSPPSHPLAQVEAVSDCERLCPLHLSLEEPSTAAAGSDTEPASDCAISVDGATMSVVVATAVPQPLAMLSVQGSFTVVPVETPERYVDPSLAHLAPPPKTSAV